VTDCAFASAPVIAVFTKFDALWGDAYGQLKRSGFSRRECSNRAPEHAKEIFANLKIWDRLCETQYPPKDCVCTACEWTMVLSILCNPPYIEMYKDSADCVPLLESTTSALGEEVMQVLLISTQRTNMTLCIKYAVEK
jgi:hypothetical protein